MMEDSIKIENLTVCYDDRSHKRDMNTILNQFSLTVPKGTVCAIIGPSGCGKSTLLKAVAGLIQSSFGVVRFGDKPINPKNFRIGFMPQNYGLLPWKSVHDNILLGCQIKGIAKSRRADMRSLCECLHIETLLDRYPHELSGGQQQRVSLARVFLLSPDVLLMDEPFSALDAITRDAMQEVFLDLWRGQSITTLLVTHYVEEALYLGDRIVIMPERYTDAITIIDNPLARDKAQRMGQKFFSMSCALRKKIIQMRSRS